MTGHMLGAAGAAELIASVLSLMKEFIAPTIGLQEPDPECDLDYVHNLAEKLISTLPFQILWDLAVITQALQ